MGDIRRTRKKYQKPSHPWEAARMAEEKPLIKNYSLANKNELWKMESIRRNIALQAKKIIAKREDKETQKEKRLLLQRLVKYNLIKPDDPIEAALAITTNDILERRLQTMVYRKNLAKTIKQARQLITHKHIMVNKKVVTSPSYLVSAEEERQIEYSSSSPFAAENHPERTIIKTQQQASEKTESVNENGTAR